MTTPSGDPNSSGLSFGNPQVAQRARDVIKQIAGNTVDAKGSNPNVGRVMSVDIARLTASVWFTGDDGPVQVNLFPGSIPLDLGDYRNVATYETSAVGAGGLVYVENFRGKPYITHVLSGGDYTLNQNVAGITHRMFNAVPRGNVQLPAVGTSIYQREINISVPSPASFVVGQAMLVGPWSGANDGTSIDGIIELTLTYFVTNSALNQVKSYKFSVSDRMIVDNPSGANKPFWMRLIPHTNLGTVPHGELAVDVGLVKSNIRTTLEFWFRLVPLDTWADQSTYFMSVKTYGSAFNVGDPSTGRLVTMTQSVADPLQGWVGFHNSGMGWTERDEYASFSRGTYYQGDEWTSGSWRSGPLRAAKDLLPLWTADGQWVFGTDFKLSWEGNIVISGIGPNWNGLHLGSLKLPQPTDFLPVFPSDPTNINSQTRDCSNGIIMNPGDTLYYGVLPGSGAGGQSPWHSANSTFFIVDSKTYAASTYSFSLPEWAFPIAHRAVTNFGERSELIITSPTVQRDLDDRNEYAMDIYVTDHGPFVTIDETETMFITNFRFRAKTAYKVRFKAGVTIGAGSAANDAVEVRLKKTLVSTGADLGEYFRYPLLSSAGAGSTIATQGELYLYNDTTADIISSFTLTMQNKISPNTITRKAGPNSPSWLYIERAGNSGKFFGLGKQI